jgi:hypothetical protein
MKVANILATKGGPVITVVDATRAYRGEAETLGFRILNP